jgi:cyclohexanone monooxygenase
MRWDDSSGRWLIQTDRGDKIRAQFVAMANGPLNRPKLPGIPGITSFKGIPSTPVAGITRTRVATRRAT